MAGAGKSHRASVVANEVGAEVILDDGLLVAKGKILAGKSAKRESTRVAAGGERPVLSCDRLSLTQLLMGYRDIDDLLLAADARGAGEGFGATGGSPPLRVKVAPGEALARLLADFPRLYPKYSDAPYYFWF